MPLLFIDGAAGPDDDNPKLGTGKTYLLRCVLREQSRQHKSLVVGMTKNTAQLEFNSFGSGITVDYLGILDLMKAFDNFGNGSTDLGMSKFLASVSGTYKNYMFDMMELPVGIDRDMFYRLIEALARNSYVYLTFKP